MPKFGHNKPYYQCIHNVQNLGLQEGNMVLRTANSDSMANTHFGSPVFSADKHEFLF